MEFDVVKMVSELAKGGVFVLEIIACKECGCMISPKWVKNDTCPACGEKLESKK